MPIEQEVIDATATGEEIGAIVKKIESVIVDEKIEHVFISLLALAVLMMNPSLGIGQLQQVLDNVSKHLLVTVDAVGTKNPSVEIAN